MESSAVQERAQHPTLWFEDGSIILVTTKTLFRVHKGVLSLNSAVFQSMFSVPQPVSPADGETLDGVPVVHLLDDEADLTHLLKALYYKT